MRDMKNAISEIFLNFMAPEYCIVNNIPIKERSDIEFLSREFFDSIEYSISTKDITIRMQEKFQKDELHINRANALLNIKMNEDYRIILHNLKYGKMQNLGYGMGKLLGKKLDYDNMDDYDIICPVPVHKIRMRERGYNQSELIGKGVSEILNINFSPDLLIRENYSVSQTKLSAEERLKNVKKSFAVNPDYSVKNLNILITDDILTTGSTLNNCALALLEAGAEKIDAATLALA